MGRKDFNKDSLGNRMKGYEDSYRSYLPSNFPIIIRIDGSHFHTYTRGMEKPFDDYLIEAFNETCRYLGENIVGAKFIYHQSDEISILLRNDDSFETQAWFKNNLQKLVSLSASLATAKFNEVMSRKYTGKTLATFDSRVFIVPENEIINYFIWRQQDCMRNSVSMVSQSQFSHKELQNKNQLMMKEMLFKIGIDYDKDIEIHKQRGSSFERITDVESGRSKWEANLKMPKITEDRSIIDKYVK